MLAPIMIQPKLFLKFKFENRYNLSKIAKTHEEENATNTKNSFIIEKINIFFYLNGLLIIM